MFISSPQSPSSSGQNKFTTISGRTTTNNNRVLSTTPTTTTPKQSKYAFYERSFSAKVEAGGESPGRFAFNHSKSMDLSEYDQRKHEWDDLKNCLLFSKSVQKKNS